MECKTWPNKLKRTQKWRLSENTVTLIILVRITGVSVVTAQSFHLKERVSLFKISGSLHVEGLKDSTAVFQTDTVISAIIFKNQISVYYSWCNGFKTCAYHMRYHEKYHC